MHGTNLSDEGISTLVPAISQLDNLRVLDLGDCGITDEGIGVLCTMLKPAQG